MSVLDRPGRLAVSCPEHVEDRHQFLRFALGIVVEAALGIAAGARQGVALLEPVATPLRVAAGHIVEIVDEKAADPSSGATHAPGGAILKSAIGLGVFDRAFAAGHIHLVANGWAVAAAARRQGRSHDTQQIFRFEPEEAPGPGSLQFRYRVHSCLLV